MTSDENLTGILDQDAVYFTIRRRSDKKWVVETLQLVGDKIVRNLIGEPTSRQGAMETFKISVVRYFAEINR